MANLTCDQAFFFFAAEGGRKKKESLIQLLVESSAAPQLKCLSTRVSAMPSDKSEPITIYRKSLRWRESAEARSGHEVCKQLYVAFCFPTNQKKVQILDFLQTTRQVIVSGVHFSVDYTAARKITPDRRLSRHGPSSHNCFTGQKVFNGGYFYHVVIFLLYWRFTRVRF